MDINNGSTHKPFLYRLASSPEEILIEASKLCIGAVSVTLSANIASIPATHPKILKEAIVYQVPSHNYIEFMKITRQGKLFVHTQAAETAIQILKIKSLLNIPVTAS